MLEEIGTKVQNIKLIGIVENFFNQGESRVQEICFVYRSEDVVSVDLPENFVQLTEEELTGKDIRPEIIKKIISESQGTISHHIIK